VYILVKEVERMARKSKNVHDPILNKWYLARLNHQEQAKKKFPKEEPPSPQSEKPVPTL